MSETRLREALDIMRERGWVQGSYEDEEGHVCGLGAVSRAWGGSHGVVPLLALEKEAEADARTLGNVAKEQAPETYDGVTDGRSFAIFNDDPRTTFADVERCFEKAAVRREEEV